MLILSGVSDLVQVVTGAIADVEVHASWADVTGTPQVVTPGRTNTAHITSATTTTVVGSPAASTQRNVKHLNITNNHATVSCFVEVLHTDGTTAEELIGVTLLPGENLVLSAEGEWRHLDVNGALYTNLNFVFTRNSISAALTPAGGATTYLVGSELRVPFGGLKLGTTFYWRISLAKTAAGTAASSFHVRIGTAGTTGDTAVLTFTLPVGTAAVDLGFIDIFVTIRGPLGASCVAFGHFYMNHSLATTGLINVQQLHLNVTSAGFTSTTTGLIVGLSVAVGASHVWTLNHCEVQALGL